MAAEIVGLVVALALVVIVVVIIIIVIVINIVNIVRIVSNSNGSIAEHSVRFGVAFGLLFLVQAAQRSEQKTALRIHCGHQR